MTEKKIKSYRPHSPIAIIGMGCIFPESRNLKEFWHLIFNGIDAIQPIPENSHWQLKDYFDSDPARPDHTYCNRGGFIPQIAFDPLSYGIPPNNIEATDTAQLLGLEVARMALADAGYPVGDAMLQEKTVNVILGVTGTQELVIPLGARLGHPLWKKALEASGVDGDKKEEILKRLDASYVQWQENSFPGLLGNVVAGRIANRLDLSGTNSVSDAACASSLAAIHTAMMELESGRCDMSITGGVDCLNDIFMHMCFSKTGVLSHTSDAKPFSKDADGTVLGEGIGMLVLKRLEDAEQDKDRIYAVIKGMGTSSDGRTSAIYAPEAKGQVKALKEAYDIAGVDPATVDLIEAHGTGTRVGDKVEFTALKQHFGSFDTPNTTAIGSVKSMIGHTKASAGAAGIIKTALALHNKVIPPTLKAEQPDPELDINGSAFYLNPTSKPWVPNSKNRSESPSPRRSGISAFGFGGSNFHAVLEEYQPEKAHVSWDGSVQILAFSAKDKPSLIIKINNFKDTLASFSKTDTGEFFQALAWLAFESRQQFSGKDELRLLALVSKTDDINDLIEKALATLEGEPKTKAPTAPIFFGSGRPAGKLGFIFPGQGSQYTGMVKDLVSIFPEAMDALSLAQSCIAKVQPTDKANPLSDYIYPLPLHVQDKKTSEEQLRQTQIAQPAIGAISLAMTDILKRFNISPEMTCGHSFGELSALYAAGWMSRESFLNLASARGHHMAAAGEQSGDVGSMLAIQAPMEKIEALIKDEALDLILANRNSHTQGVLSGSTKEIDRAKELCRQKKMRAVKLPVAAAFHSRLVQNATAPFKACVTENTLTPSKIDVLSNTSGQVYPRDDKAIKDLLGSQLMHPVNFIDNIETMHENGISTFIEIGPKAVLTGLTKAILKNKKILACSLDSSGGKKPGIYDLGLALCTIASQGFSVDLTQWEDQANKPLPKKMTLMLSGANPKPVSNTNIPVSPAWAPAPRIEKNTESTTQIRQGQTTPATDQSKTQGSDMTPSPRFLKESIIEASPSQEAILLVHKGLEAMQQLQEQTARAHEKFLETQTQASKTLASMMEQTRGFVSNDSMVVSQTIPSDSQPIKPVMHERKPEPPPAPAPVSQPEPSLPTPLKTRPAVPEAAADRPAELTADLPVQKVLYETVSRLTGFPVEMLEPDMDIESDLGIDSIKKVEIISELEKQIPGGEGLSTDHLASVRTLDDICRAMASDSNMVQPPQTNDQVANSPTPVPQTTEGPDRIFTVLTEIVSELTGFPVEMLEPDMNLESDLGIDSIKRVEILSRLEQELDDLNNISPDDMGNLNTIQDIVNFLTPSTETISAETHKKKTPIHAASESIGRIGEDAPTRTLLRQEIVLKEYPTNQIRFYNGAKIDIPSGKKVYLTRDHSGLAICFKKEFENLGIQAELINISVDKIPDLSDAAGLVLLPDAFHHPDDLTAKSFLSTAFCLASKNADHLMASAKEKGAFLTTISFSGGHFSFKVPDLTTSPLYGGLAGLAKTADLEWKDVLCRALDMPGTIEQCKENAEAAVALMMTHGAVEMGLDGETCCIPTLESKKVKEGPVNLTPEDVVVITGGAKGVTAECAVYLAREFNPKIVLLGRSPAPFQEPEWLQGISEPGDIKKLILTHEFKGQKVRPAEIESRYQTLISNRTVQENLNRIKEFSPQAQYISVDIRDSKQVKAVFNKIRKTQGKISAIIHGAGVLEDKLIAEKRLDQFERVFNTKVLGLEALMEAGKTDPLKYLVLFSSIAARLGNTGQCDYAMANEVLNKVAQVQALKNPECRFLSINWGPWAGGMVNDGLKREFTKRGIDLIPLGQGAEQLVKEMGNPDRHAIEVVVGAALNPPSPHSTKKPVQTKALDQVFGTQSSPIINSHRIAHDPVVPFAMMAELLAHAAEKNNPGLHFAGLDEMRLFKGIVPRENEISAQVDLGKCTPGNSEFHTSGSLSSMDLDGNPLLHAKAVIFLKNELPEPPALSKAAFMDLKPYGMSIEQAYEEILFHGKELQCITAVNGVSQKGIEVVSMPAPGIDLWYAKPHSKEWTIDPMILDAAFQAAILWTYETRKAVCLPSYIANLKLYASYKNRTGNIRILFTVNHESQHKVQGYFTFLDATDTVIASIMGFEATIDTKLLDKFKAKPLFSREKILAFAQGKPSHAFGEAYKVFDKDRQIARLPRPPYFFMDRILKADHPQWEMTTGQWIEAEYDIPGNEWYFEANRTNTLPFCILLEIALQPCGWLAAYAGSALQSDDRLHFRNLGGKAQLLGNIPKDTGTLTMRSRMTDVSKAGGMIIQNFDLEVLSHGRMVYQGTTNFGFFTKEALSNQVGIRNSRFTSELSAEKNYDPVVFDDEAPITPLDINSSSNSGMPAKSLRMIDQIDYLDLTGGLYKNGYIKASKKVDPKEWFFDAHFYQDPVCPGSLGVESFLQMLRFYLTQRYNIDTQGYEVAMAPGNTHEWAYRGQIVPANKKVEIHAHVKETSEESSQYMLIADGALSVDGICIYEMIDFGIKFIPINESENQIQIDQVSANK